MKSKKPSKQRKALYKAPLHRRQKLIAAHLSKPLIKQWGTRSLGVRKGDEVKIIRGDFKGKIGKIIRVDLKKLKVYIEGIKKKKVSGEEYQVAFHPSNLIITSPLVDDARRKVIITRRGGKVKESETKKTSSA